MALYGLIVGVVTPISGVILPYLQLVGAHLVYLSNERNDLVVWVIFGCFPIQKIGLYPKDPGMSQERDFPYYPILGMGLRPSILL